MRTLQRRYYKKMATGGWSSMDEAGKANLIGQGTELGSTVLDAAAPADSYGVKSNGAAIGSGALKGAGTGAAIGSAIPGVGTVIGAGVGAVVGGVTGLLGNKKAQEQKDKLVTAKGKANALSQQAQSDAVIAADPSKKYGNLSASFYAMGGTLKGTGPTKPRMIKPIPSVVKPPRFMPSITESPGRQLSRMDNGGRVFKTSDPSYKYPWLVKGANGGQLTPLSSEDTKVEGPSHASGGVKLPNIGVELEGGETINKGFVFSKKLGFAQEQEKIARQLGKVEKQPDSPLTRHTIDSLQRKTNLLKSYQESTKAAMGIPNDLENHPEPEQMGNGGGIHIKPSHKGRFTEYKDRTGKTTEEALHSSDTHVRKMAQFAKNAKSWNKKADGGEITTDPKKKVITNPIATGVGQTYNPSTGQTDLGYSRVYGSPSNISNNNIAALRTQYKNDPATMAILNRNIAPAGEVPMYSAQDGDNIRQILGAYQKPQQVTNVTGVPKMKYGGSLSSKYLKKDFGGIVDDPKKPLPPNPIPGMNLPTSEYPTTTLNYNGQPIQTTQVPTNKVRSTAHTGQNIITKPQINSKPGVTPIVKPVSTKPLPEPLYPPPVSTYGKSDPNEQINITEPNMGVPVVSPTPTQKAAVTTPNVDKPDKSVVGTLAKGFNMVSPFLSNINNAITKLPLPPKPILDDPITPNLVNYDASRAEAIRQTRGANKAAEQNLNTGAAVSAVRAANLSQQQRSIGQIDEAENNTNTGIRNQANAQNTAIKANNNNKVNNFNNELVSRTLKEQQNRSQNLADVENKIQGMARDKKMFNQDDQKIMLTALADNTGASFRGARDIFAKNLSPDSLKKLDDHFADVEKMNKEDRENGRKANQLQLSYLKSKSGN